MNIMGAINLVIRIAFAALFTWSLYIGVPQVVVGSFFGMVQNVSHNLFYVISLALILSLVYGAYKMFVKGSYFFTIFAIYFLIVFSHSFFMFMPWNYPYLISVAMSWMQTIFGFLLVAWGIIEYFLANKF